MNSGSAKLKRACFMFLFMGRKYFIEDFSPRKKMAPVLSCIRFYNMVSGSDGDGFDNNDFSIRVRRDWAYRALKTELTRFRMDEFRERGYEILSCFPNLKKYPITEIPYIFFPLSNVGVGEGAYSCLLSSCSVSYVITDLGREKTCLELKIKDIEELKNEKTDFVYYVPRNIVDTDQATALMILFFNWINNLQH